MRPNDFAYGSSNSNDSGLAESNRTNSSHTWQKYLISITGAILCLASFGWYSADYYEVIQPTVTKDLLYFRILPLTGIFVCLALTSPGSNPWSLFERWLRPPFSYFLWFLFVGLISGIVNGISPMYSTWKGIEIAVVLFWGSYLALYINRFGDIDILKTCFLAIHWSIYILTLWTLISVVGGPFSWFDEIPYNPRLTGFFPIINPIQLGFLAAFNIIINISFIRRQSSRKIFILLLMIPSFVVLIRSQSRTGALGLLIALFFFACLQTKNISYKTVGISFIITALIVPLIALTEITDLVTYFWFRDQSLERAMLLSARINVSWRDSIEFIKHSPLIGYGILNLSRFAKEEIFGVDNTYLQLTLQSGFIGATPLIGFIFLGLIRWVRRFLQRHNRSKQLQMLIELGFYSYILVFIRTLFVNELAFFGTGLVLFILSVLSFEIESNRRFTTVLDI